MLKFKKQFGSGFRLLAKSGLNYLGAEFGQELLVELALLCQLQEQSVLTIKYSFVFKKFKILNLKCIGTLTGLLNNENNEKNVG